jgi:hypothetical protein
MLLGSRNEEGIVPQIFQNNWKSGVLQDKEKMFSRPALGFLLAESVATVAAVSQLSSQMV